MIWLVQNGTPKWHGPKPVVPGFILTLIRFTPAWPRASGGRALMAALLSSVKQMCAANTSDVTINKAPGSPPAAPLCYLESQATKKTEFNQPTKQANPLKNYNQEKQQPNP